MMNIVSKLSLNNEKVLIRVDFNVPFSDLGKVTDDTRIRAVKPTIDYVLSKGGSCILMSHLGRPRGKDVQFSLSKIQEKVSEILEVPVIFAKDCIGTETQEMANSLQIYK